MPVILLVEGVIAALAAIGVVVSIGNALEKNVRTLGEQAPRLSVLLIAAVIGIALVVKGR